MGGWVGSEWVVDTWMDRQRVGGWVDRCVGGSVGWENL